MTGHRRREDADRDVREEVREKFARLEEAEVSRDVEHGVESEGPSVSDLSEDA